MKRSNHHEINRLVQYVQSSSAEELMSTYGIQIMDLGEVYDTVENRIYPTPRDWANSIVDQEVDDTPVHHKRSKFDDFEF